MVGLLDILGFGRGGMDENGTFRLQDPAMLGLLTQQEPQGAQMPFGILSGMSGNSPAMPLSQSFGLNGANMPSMQPQDLPAPGASPVSDPAMPPMPPQRPEGLGFNNPTQAQGFVPPMPPERPANLPAPSAAPAGPAPSAPASTPAKDEPGFLSKFGDAIGSIYGKGGPGDSLIALGAGLASGPNWGSGLMKGMAMVNANALTAKKKEEEQRKSAGQVMLAQHISSQSGGRVTPQAALGIIQSGNAGQFLSDQFRSPTSEQEYNVYKQTEIAAGRTPSLTFDQWYTRNKQIESGVGETSFEQGAAKSQVERLNKTVEAGSQARASLVDIGQMREISGRLGSQGSVADFKARIGPMAEALGIKLDGLSDIQAFNSIVQRVAPTLREPGSGSTSDIEFRGMLNALPQLSSNPAARTAILDTMEAMARDKQARGEIAAKVLNREIPRQDGDRMLRELPDPLIGFKAFKEQNQSLFSGQPQATQQGQGDQPPVAGARKAADGQWYVQQNGKWFKVQQ